METPVFDKIIDCMRDLDACFFGMHATYAEAYKTVKDFNPLNKPEWLAPKYEEKYKAELNKVLSLFTELEKNIRAFDKELFTLYIKDNPQYHLIVKTLSNRLTEYMRFNFIKYFNSELKDIEQPELGRDFQLKKDDNDSDYGFMSNAAIAARYNSSITLEDIDKIGRTPQGDQYLVYISDEEAEKEGRNAEAEYKEWVNGYYLETITPMSPDALKKDYASLVYLLNWQIMKVSGELERQNREPASEEFKNGGAGAIEFDLHKLNEVRAKLLFIKYSGIYESIQTDLNNRTGKVVDAQAAKIISYLISEKPKYIISLMGSMRGFLKSQTKNTIYKKDAIESALKALDLCGYNTDELESILAKVSK